MFTFHLSLSFNRVISCFQTNLLFFYFMLESHLKHLSLFFPLFIVSSHKYMHFFSYTITHLPLHSHCWGLLILWFFFFFFFTFFTQPSINRLKCSWSRQFSLKSARTSYYRTILTTLFFDFQDAFHEIFSFSPIYYG